MNPGIASHRKTSNAERVSGLQKCSRSSSCADAVLRLEVALVVVVDVARDIRVLPLVMRVVAFSRSASSFVIRDI